MKIAYFVSRFPHPYQTFIRREIDGITACGASITVFPIVGEEKCNDIPPAPAANAESVKVVPSGFFSPDVRRSFLRSLGTSPRACFSLLGLILAGTCANPFHLLKSLAIFPKRVHLANLLREGNYDHIHAHWSTYPATAAMIASELTGIPFSFAFHAYDIYSTRIMIPEKIRRAKAVIVNCRYTLEFIRELYPAIDESNFHLVYNGLELRRFEFRRRPAQADIPEILAVGQLVPSKGFAYLLEACRIMNAEKRVFKATIIGDGPLRHSLQDFISRHGMKNVSLAGAKPETEVIEHMKRASVLVMPSVKPESGSHDGLPNVVIEAAALGTPVVASAVFGIPELIVNGETGLLVPEQNPPAIRDAVVRLLDDPALADRLSAAARKKAEAGFDIHSNCARLLSIFSSSAGTPESSASNQSE